MILVTGVPGSRTSMTMRLLEALGIPCLYQVDGEPSNFDGDYEGPWTHSAISTPDYPAGSAAKVFIPALQKSNLTGRDRIVLCFRRPSDVWNSRPAITRFNYWRLYQQFLTWHPTTPYAIHYLDTDALCADPEHGVAELARFIGASSDLADAASLVRQQPHPAEETEQDATTTLWEYLRGIA